MVGSFVGEARAAELIEDAETKHGPSTKPRFPDHDVLILFDARLDGIEDPDGAVNQRLGMGDLRAAEWSGPFGHPPARDPERGFRR
ncbi:hypothetical protein ACWD1Y_05985 [Streptomyces sp. NPDC002814]